MQVRKTLAEDRLHAETVLQQGTSAVYAKLKENAVNQASKNEQMKSWTTRMKLDAMDSIRNAKEDFVKKIKDLGTVVSNNDKKADGTIKELAGVVQENAEKSLQGRKAVRNKAQHHTTVFSLCHIVVWCNVAQYHIDVQCKMPYCRHAMPYCCQV